jgi:hypothetical protein
VSTGLSVRKKPKRLLPDGPDIRSGDLFVCDWAFDGIQHITRALDFTAPMPGGGYRGLDRAKKDGRSLKVGVLAVEKEQGKRDSPGEPKVQAKRGNIYTMQGRYRRAQVHFWLIAIEGDGHCPDSFLTFFTSVGKELTEQNSRAFKQHWWKRVVCELHQTNAKLALQRAAAACRALFRLPIALAPLMNYKTTSYKPTCLLKLPTAFRTVTVNGIPEMPGPPASARGTPVQLHTVDSWRALCCVNRC